MSSRRNKLLTSSFVATFVFVFLLAIHLPSSYAGGGPHAVTAYGNSQIDTAQSKFGGASGLFDGTGDYLSTPDHNDWYFGTGDFTIDFWVRFNAITAWVSFYDQQPVSTSRFIIEMNPTGNAIRVVVDATVIINAATGMTTGNWYHVAVVRNENNWYLFINGSLIASATNSIAVSDYSAPLVIGAYAGGTSQYLNGWLDEYRVSKGIARWTSNFTPPSAAYTADSYTVLLLHMNGADGSTTFTDDSVPTGPDFSISASPTSQTVGAGSTASYTLSLTASGGYIGTVSLSVTSVLPSGATGTITPDSVNSYPATATLSVSTLITTPGGTSSIVVTATDGTITHTVTVSLTVSAPVSYSFNVKASATQIMVTLTYSWSGSGSPPLGNITIAGPSGIPTLSESGAVVYDRTSITVSGGTSTYAIIHRATFTITAPGSAQTWTALILLAGVSNYNVAIEVS